MNILAAVVVQIIGLAVVRDERQMGGMHVVLPTVVTESSQVESHSAILVFKDADHVKYENQWPWQAFEGDSGYSYVTLEGERVRFVLNGRNATAKIPAELPHLRQPCMEELSEGYQPPAYGAAAAVVLLPRGDTKACRNPDTHGRIDTRVWMVNTGNFQVVAGNKSITLRDRAVIAIINAPTEWIERGTSTAKMSAPHSRAYFAMAQARPAWNAPKCTLRPPAKIKTCPSLDFYTPPVNPADLPVAMHHLAAAAAQDGRPDLPDTGGHGVPMATFECSNTQWP